MAVVRTAVFLLLLAAAVLFGMYAYTGQPRYKRMGLATLKWTLVAAFGFFAVLIAERLIDQ
ncbi:hypothetical protein EZ313_01060 [Ramlibacter henchirensis]|jgi:hypothetical protein|uniref:Uncharacterized protein n=1 Tax=Ramlibacter henchirensis TaxID=204072 RepID=A0A4Z0C382_9BURK|nr:hypothetical protein [Ramlibacter henchirensis]TFZ05294.1 hypothetical protein EZ313_01060 [Ramlibacter henchirensis]